MLDRNRAISLAEMLRNVVRDARLVLQDAAY